MRLALVTAFTAVAFGLFAASCGTATTCSPQSCPTGCCSEAGECLSGGENSACGSGGNACINCAATALTCGNKVCIATGTGGGSGMGGGGGSTTGGGGGSAMGGGGGSATGGGGGTTTDAGCPRALAPADRTRYLVASHPFPSDGGSRDDLYEVFSVSPSGAVASTGRFFRMGRANDYTSPIVFTPDGVVGIAAQENGTLGVFTLDSAGVPTVVHAAFDPAGASSGKLLMHPAGNSLFLTDFNTQNNGGGLYRVDIGCDGTLLNPRQVLPGNNAAAATWLPNQEFLVVASRDLQGSPAMQDLHLVDVATSPPVVRASSTGFPDRDAIPPTVSVSADGRWIVLPDTGFSGGDRLAVFERSGTTLTARQVLTTASPVAVVFSPFDTTGLVVNSDTADHFRRFTFDGGAFAVAATPLPYTFGRPELPGAPVMIDRGALTGRLFVPELLAVRQLQFERDGGITDVAKTPAGGTGSGQILGTLGIQP